MIIQDCKYFNDVSDYIIICTKYNEVINSINYCNKCKFYIKKDKIIKDLGIKND